MIRIEWTESRYESGEWISFRVVASKGSGVWQIVEGDRWDSKSYPVLKAAKPRYERVAEHARRGSIDGFVRPGMIVVVAGDPREPAACEIYGSPLPMRGKISKDPSVIVIEVLFNAISGLSTQDTAHGNDRVAA